ncbi:stage 0 sporulation protein j, partial (plasmid) [Candidatus Burkholderia crenata]
MSGLPASLSRPNIGSQRCSKTHLS